LEIARAGSRNIRFSDLVRLARAFGWREARVSGSHHIHAHPKLHELLNLQDVQGKAKPYQVRQLLRLVERYKLSLKDDQ
jgi:predicted RNA binding protein YcfA (HicA-like mRNA interferase family)